MSFGPLIITELILVFISLYPFYLLKYKQNKYTGIWKKIGDTNKTPIRSLLYPIGYLIGGIIYLLYFQ